MVSNQILKRTIEKTKEIDEVPVAIFDAYGIPLASSVEKPERYMDRVREFATLPEKSMDSEGLELFKAYEEEHLEYIVLVEGMGKVASIVGKMTSLKLEELLVAYSERYDTESFFKNLLLDNLLLIDIYNKSKKLHIDYDKKRICIIVETGESKDGGDIARIYNIIGKRQVDFVTAVDENSVIIIRQLEDSDTEDTVVELANKIIIDMKELEGRDVRVSYGTSVNSLKDVSKSYKEANLALDVGKIFFKDHKVIAYSLLGIGRLIYQLPIPLCTMFIDEIFKGKSPKDFDEETITTINKFFENSLNVSETSRQLYIHRNTLVYRIDKLQKMTGLDIRVFEDAITFKIALMVVEYMTYMDDNKF